jgi:hypothetical protein
MIRGDFLRTAILAPLAALLGRREAPPVGTDAVVAKPPITASAWTIATMGGTATVWVSGADGRWVALPDSDHYTYTDSR